MIVVISTSAQDFGMKNTEAKKFVTFTNKRKGSFKTQSRMLKVSRSVREKNQQIHRLFIQFINYV
jgi:hypothetical protein